jgi:4-amino-4-deoxy-L-arabinose transferase-like glycosyltransferase
VPGQRPITGIVRRAALVDDVPASVARIAWAASGVAFALFLVALPRVPIPWGDEIWMASASYSIAHGGGGVPGALPPGPWYASFTHVYGPVFFYLSAIFVRLFGLSATSARLACVIGAGLLVISSALLVRAAGGSMRWGALACAVMTLTPEVGTIATNGRMDALAIGLEIAGMAALTAAVGQDHRQSRLYGAAAGALWLLAVLTSPRALPLLGGLAMGGVWLAIDRRSRWPAVMAEMCAAAVFLAGGLLWLHHMGVTPVEWARSYLESSRSDAQNILLPGQPRVWGLEARNTITPAVMIVAATGLLMLLWLPGRSGRGATDDSSGPNRSLAPAIIALLVAGVVNVAFIFVVANHVFTSGSYFVLPLFAAVLATTVYVGRRTGHPQIVLLFWLAVATFFGAARVVKYVEVVQTWRYRDPASLRQFVERWVPAGSLVFGYDQYYYYAVQNAGSTFRSWTPTPFPPAAFGRPVGISVEGEPSLALADKRFLLWPINGEPGPVPPSFACATPHVVARFSITDAGPTGVEQLGGFISALHGYPDSMLYRLPEDCHP